jgi:hypothetical protein
MAVPTGSAAAAFSPAGASRTSGASLSTPVSAAKGVTIAPGLLSRRSCVCPFSPASSRYSAGPAKLRRPPTTAICGGKSSTSEAAQVTLPVDPRSTFVAVADATRTTE